MLQSTTDLAGQLRVFRQEHPLRRLDVGGATWEFFSAGRGSRTVILLPGGGGGPEDMFTLMAGLENEFRVVAIGCPLTVTRAQDVMDGIAAIMDEEGVGKACLLGHSLGGLFAECFMMKHPERAGSMILANIAHYGTLRMAVIRRVLPVMSHLGWLLPLQTRATFHRLLKGRPEREFWLSYLCAEADKAGADGLSNRVKCMRDMIGHFPAVPADLKGWNGPVLILESDNETGFTKSERLALRRLYANAEVHVFHGAGHLSAITQPREFEEVVRRFLNA